MSSIALDEVVFYFPSLPLIVLRDSNLLIFRHNFIEYA